MQESHVRHEINRPTSRNRILNIQMVSRLKKDRCKINENSIQNWIQFYMVRCHIRLYLMRQVVIDWVTQVLRLKQFAKFVQIHMIFRECLYKDVKTAFLLICVETNSVDFIALASVCVLLIF